MINIITVGSYPKSKVQLSYKKFKLHSQGILVNLVIRRSSEIVISMDR